MHGVVRVPTQPTGNTNTHPESGIGNPPLAALRHEYHRAGSTECERHCLDSLSVLGSGNISQCVEGSFAHGSLHLLVPLLDAQRRYVFIVEGEKLRRKRSCSKLSCSRRICDNSPATRKKEYEPICELTFESCLMSSQQPLPLAIQDAFLPAADFSLTSVRSIIYANQVFEVSHYQRKPHSALTCGL